MEVDFSKNYQEFKNINGLGNIKVIKKSFYIYEVTFNEQKQEVIDLRLQSLIYSLVSKST